MKNLVIVGSSGFAKEIKWIIDRINEVTPQYNFIGYIDKEQKDNVIGDDDYIVNYPKKLAVVIAIADPSIRKNIVNKYSSNHNLLFPNIIDPSVIMSDSVQIGQGNIIGIGCILSVDVSLSDFCIINSDCTIGHGAIVGSYTTVYPSVNISGNVCLEKNVSIGVGTQVLQGLSIGERTIVGAGAVVTKDLQSDCVAVGVPAKVIKELREGI